MVRCGVSPTSLRTVSQCVSNRRRRLPPIRSGATLPVARQRATHLGTEETLTP